MLAVGAGRCKGSTRTHGDEASPFRYGQPGGAGARPEVPVTTALERLRRAPYTVGHLVLVLREEPPSALLDRLGAAVLVGRLPDGSEDLAMVQTRLSLVPNTPALESAGLSTDMLCWPLIRSGLSALMKKDLPVGRDAACAVRIPHADISKVHARLFARGDSGFALADAGSTNGTFVRARRLAAGEEVELASGDHVRFGPVSVRFMSRDGFLVTLRTQPAAP